uniref:Methyltransferase n=2 Tax=Phaeomonas parva TaxID=124430 RepID=A0A7S1XKD9_9STRA|mmetsp:Transcript_16356/g.49974  ORF Transcript_16356/g.49974 Transcript_16356/m.49974 type:complete len:202 (+) Transcript_16356:108-713(+)
MGLADRCASHQGDFQKLDEKFEAGTFDCAYEIEATCHSPNKTDTFLQVAHCLKKGGLFAGYEWVMCGDYDPNNKDHVRIKEGIEVGNGLPTLHSGEYVVKSLEDAGFEVIEAYDANRGVHDPAQIPWYETLNGTWSLSGFRMTWAGRMCTHMLVNVLEFLRIAPAGSAKVSSMLNATAIDLVDGGKQAIFTPSYFFLARKK